jgi:ELWxxDGT repeat protein
VNLAIKVMQLLNYKLVKHLAVTVLAASMTTGTLLPRTTSAQTTPDYFEPSNLTNVNGMLYFQAYSRQTGRELWKSNGTAAGTVLIKDINPGIGNSDSFNFTNVNGTLYFVANNGTQGHELWKSNGTAAGTVLVKDIVPGSSGSSPYNLTNVNGTGSLVHMVISKSYLNKQANSFSRKESKVLKP